MTNLVATTSRDRFRRNIFRGYPVHLLPVDLRSDLEEDPRVTVTVDALGGIVSGDTFIEAIFEYLDNRVVKLSEAVQVWQ